MLLAATREVSEKLLMEIWQIPQRDRHFINSESTMRALNGLKNTMTNRVHEKVLEYYNGDRIDNEENCQNEVNLGSDIQGQVEAPEIIPEQHEDELVVQVPVLKENVQERSSLRDDDDEISSPVLPIRWDQLFLSTASSCGKKSQLSAYSQCKLPLLEQSSSKVVPREEEKI